MLKAAWVKRSSDRSPRWQWETNSQASIWRLPKAAGRPAEPDRRTWQQSPGKGAGVDFQARGVNTGSGRRASSGEKLFVQGHQRAQPSALGDELESIRAGEREQFWAERPGATTPLPPPRLGGGTKLASRRRRTGAWHCFGLPRGPCWRQTDETNWGVALFRASSRTLLETNRRVAPVGFQLAFGSLTGGTSLAAGGTG